MKIEYIFLIVAAISIVLALILKDEDTRCVFACYSFILIFFSIIIIFFSFLHPNKAIPEELKLQRSEYTVYLDGEEVDNNKIDLNLYRTTYDDEKKVVYAAR